MYRLRIYLNDTGTVFEYEVASEASAREHAQKIALYGYRSASKDRPDELTVYPPHRIDKVKIIGKITTHYWDTISGT